LVAAGFSACTDNSRQIAGPAEGPPGYGWRLAGLTSNGAKGGWRFVQLVNVGTHLYALGDSGQVFEGQQGSLTWNRLQLPDTAFGWVLAVDSTHLYVGTREDARIFRYAPGGLVEDMRLPWTGLKDVDGLSFYQGKPICSIYQKNSLFWKCYRWTGSDWSEWKGAFGTDDSTTWDPWLVGQEWKGWFYAGTNASGVWRRKDGDTAWEEVPRPVAVNSTVADKQPRSFQIWGDSLFIGFQVNSLFRINLDGSYVDYRNRQTPADTGILEIPVQLFAVGVANDHLLTAGWYSAIPLLYSRKTRHWKYVSDDSWCYKVNGSKVCPGGPATMSLVTVGDTLYACGTNNIMKFPIAELPEE
jgi:hypothetical protein